MSAGAAGKKDPNVHAGHRKRLKDRFLREGMDGMEPHVVLELLLFYAVAQRDTNEIAHNLLKKFGSLSGVFEADHDELMTVAYVGESAATLLKMIPELSRRYANDCDVKSLTLTSHVQIGEFMVPKFIGKMKETIYLLCMDSRGCVLFHDYISEGTVDTAAIYTREITKIAVKCNAVSVVLAHNHPKGIAVPSNMDLAATELVFRALSTVKIRLLDHIIVAGKDFTSLSDSGFFTHLK